MTEWVRKDPAVRRQHVPRGTYRPHARRFTHRGGRAHRGALRSPRLHPCRPPRGYPLRESSSRFGVERTSGPQHRRTGPHCLKYASGGAERARGARGLSSASKTGIERTRPVVPRGTCGHGSRADVTTPGRVTCRSRMLCSRHPHHPCPQSVRRPPPSGRGAVPELPCSRRRSRNPRELTAAHSTRTATRTSAPRLQARTRRPNAMAAHPRAPHSSRLRVVPPEDRLDRRRRWRNEPKPPSQGSEAPTARIAAAQSRIGITT